jgi:hypothetical protein
MKLLYTTQYKTCCGTPPRITPEFGLILVSFQCRDFSLVPALEPHLKTVKLAGENIV